MRLGLFSRLLFTFRLHSDSIRACSGHPSNAHTPRIQSESFVSRYLKFALPFSRHSFETQGLFMVRGFFQVVRKPTAGFCGLSIDRGVFLPLDFGADFLPFFLPTIGGVWTEYRVLGAHTAWEARP